MLVFPLFSYIIVTELLSYSSQIAQHFKQMLLPLHQSLLGSSCSASPQHIHSYPKSLLDYQSKVQKYYSWINSELLE